MCQKTRTPPARFIRRLTPDTFRIAVGNTVARYRIRELPCAIESARGFQVEKLDTTTPEEARDYAVLLGMPGNGSCECMGFLRWGRSCKHQDGIRALVARNLL